jgi:hypothetical protein
MQGSLGKERTLPGRKDGINLEVKIHWDQLDAKLIVLDPINFPVRLECSTLC